MVRQMLDRNFYLNHAEPASKKALSKLTAYLELAEDIERTSGHGALLELENPIVASLIGRNCFSEEKLCAARQQRRVRREVGRRRSVHSGTPSVERVSAFHSSISRCNRAILSDTTE
jgi:hypothetical protein